MLRIGCKFGLELRQCAAILTSMYDRRPEHPSPAPNYTRAFLTSFGVLLFMGLFAIWALWGMLMAMIVGWIADRLITVDFRGRH